MKRLIKDLIPPFFFRILTSLFLKNKNTFKGSFQSWSEAQHFSSGYDHHLILEKVLNSTLKVKKGEAAYERDSVVFDEIQYSWPVTSGLMWAAAQSKGKLSVLDFGGSLGSSYFQNNFFLNELSEVRWSIIEQSHFVEVGKKLIEDENLKFYETIEEYLKYERPNVILLSSVLQYLDNPFDVLTKLLSINANLLIIDRTPFSKKSTDEIMIQNVSPDIYSANYPIRIFSESKFLDEISLNWELVLDFSSPEGYVKCPSGLFEFKGFLFKKIIHDKDC
jgi:putative methyltransferase (TIGR04325 family)